MPLKTAIIGGSGLLARHIRLQLALDERFAVDVLSRTRPEELPARAGFLECDVTWDASRIAEALRDFDLVVNAASYVGQDRMLQQAVNDRGASAVARIIEGTEGASLIHVSTAGVYGALPYPGGEEASYQLAPESMLSVTRAAGEQAALLSGAVVLRPLFVTGVGDEHFLLPLLRAHLALGAWIEEGHARLSVVSADFVGRVVHALGLEHGTGRGNGVVHVVQQPTLVRDLLTPLLERVGTKLGGSVSLDEAVARLAVQGVPQRKVSQFASDYFLSSNVVSRLLGSTSANDLPPVSSVASNWYVGKMVA